MYPSTYPIPFLHPTADDTAFLHLGCSTFISRLYVSGLHVTLYSLHHKHLSDNSFLLRIVFCPFLDCIYYCCFYYAICIMQCLSIYAMNIRSRIAVKLFSLTLGSNGEEMETSVTGCLNLRNKSWQGF